ncbi:hypothetical protein [Bradyrhizobium sp. NP1]|jgi:hypothetical protein|uniref:hypothetical protein n=1 Tax=Bradyrhizobium sp. NP1 TaxID=3049772 RepID=UPI0025A5D435|nr:hypothetical protein [Bradyrhizobium sp. NP1]WJR79664.1 hypothetical protein QOU61_07790 [Bradyrhizobium sp. NP1]
MRPHSGGFHGKSVSSSSRLIDAVAASLAAGAVSLCVMVALTVLSIRVGMAMPI